MSSIQGLQLPSSVNTMTLGQKMVAGAIALGVGYLALPIILSVMVNALMIVIVGSILGFLGMNYKSFARLFVWAADQITFGTLSLDLLGAMDRYVLWVKDQKQILIGAKANLLAQVVANQSDIQEREKAYVENMNRADAADKMTPRNQVQYEIALSNAQEDKDYIRDISPMVIEGEKHVAYLDELIDIFEINSQKLEYSVKAQKSKYKSIKAMQQGTAAAVGVIGGANEQTKMWNKTNELLAAKMNKMTADIKTFEDILKPAIEGNRFDKQLRETTGRKLLEEFRTNARQLTTTTEKELVKR